MRILSSTTQFFLPAVNSALRFLTREVSSRDTNRNRNVMGGEGLTLIHTWAFSQVFAGRFLDPTTVLTVSICVKYTSGTKVIDSGSVQSPERKYSLCQLILILAAGFI